MEVMRQRQSPVAKIVERVAKEYAVAIDEVFSFRVAQNGFSRPSCEHLSEQRFAVSRQSAQRRRVENAAYVQFNYRREQAVAAVGAVATAVTRRCSRATNSWRHRCCRRFQRRRTRHLHINPQRSLFQKIKLLQIHSTNISDQVLQKGKGQFQNVGLSFAWSCWIDSLCLEMQWYLKQFDCNTSEIAVHKMPLVKSTGPFRLLVANVVLWSFVRHPVTGACALLRVGSLAQTFNFPRQRTLSRDSISLSLSLSLSLSGWYMSGCLSVFGCKRFQLPTVKQMAYYIVVLLHVQDLIEFSSTYRSDSVI